MSSINLNTNQSPVISDRHQNPLVVNNKASKKDDKFVIYAVLAIITTVLFLALVFMLWSEWSLIKDA